MKIYKNFLIRICDLENVKIKELMELTGKSQAVVYSWLNFSKPDFPTIESLGKILFRLGMSFDDFLNCRHPIYDNGSSARIYYRYAYGSYDQRYIDKGILELSNAEEIMKTYLYDRMHLKKMIEEYVNGLDIDVHRFDFLCKALQPVIVSDITTDAEQSVYELNSQTLNDYKIGLACLKEIEEENNGDPDFKIPEHYIYFPDAEYVILLAADQSLSMINEYLTVITDREKARILESYMSVCADHPKYDKKNRILKRLMECNCSFYKENSEDVGEKYGELMQRILKLR